MHVDQMEDLGLDVKAYAEPMAEALALMHWGAGVDAGDVEYVLAPPRSSSSSAFQSSFLGEHTMWILDFDCVRRITMNGAGLERACKAFWENNPFCPRPGGAEDVDEVLWEVFKEAFLKASVGF
jgi:hypothetical protein